jgi:peptidoglycan/xylan/chitin deacetylase (PgdA/CDA1 family)
MRAVPIALVLALVCAAAPRLSAEDSGAAGDEHVLAADQTRVLRGASAGAPEAGALRFTADGPGARAAVGNPAPFDPPLDFSGRVPVIRVRVDDMRRLAGSELVLLARGGALAIPIPVFADAPFNMFQSGEWIDLSLPFGRARIEGAPDRAAVHAVEWRVTEVDAPGPRLSAAWGGLFARPLPAAGVVSFTFDDGYDEHFDVAAPLLAAHGMRGTAYVMPDQVGEVGYMTLSELRALRERFGWDVAAHHFVPLTDVSPDELPARLDSIQHYLVRNGFGDGAAHLAYPLGKYEPRWVLPQVRERFATARLASGGPETLPPADPHRLRVMNVLDATTPDEIRAAARRAREQREWLILMFHFLVDAPQGQTEYAISDLREVVAGLAADGAAVAPVSEVWRRFAQPPAAPTP